MAGQGKVDFRSRLLDENEMAEQTEQVQGGGMRPGMPLGIITNVVHTFSLTDLCPKPRACGPASHSSVRAPGVPSSGNCCS